MIPEFVQYTCPRAAVYISSNVSVPAHVLSVSLPEAGHTANRNYFWDSLDPLSLQQRFLRMNEPWIISQHLQENWVPYLALPHWGH